MKKIFALAVTLTLGVTLMAQNKGDITLGGNLSVAGGSYSVSYDGESESTSVDTDFSIGASFGYFIMDKLEIGGSLNFNLSQSISSFMITPYAKYYFPLISEKLFYTPAFSLGFGTPADRWEDIDVPGFQFKMSLDILALEFKPIEKLGIGMTMGGLYYTLQSYSEDDITFSINDVSLNLSTIFSPTFSVKYYF